MNEKQYLGIHLSPAGATVALVGEHPAGPRIEESFFVPAPDPLVEERQGQHLAALVRRACDERDLVYSRVAMSLERGYFTRHKMRSEFTDPGRIARTVKFDAEDVITVDTSNLAITFETLMSDEKGTQLEVFAAEKAKLSAILSEFTAAGLEPVAMEPDAVALARWLERLVVPSQHMGSVHMILQVGSCTFVIWVSGRSSPHIRTILTGESFTSATAGREIAITTASLGAAGTFRKVRLFDATGAFDLDGFRAATPLAVETFDLYDLAGKGENVLPLAIASAAGAAVGETESSHIADFREDFAPHMGRRRAMDRALKASCIALTVIIVALGTFLQFRLMGLQRDRERLHEALASDYRPVMMTETMPELRRASQNLSSALLAARERRSGIITSQGQETVTSLLTYVFEALNELPASVNFEIESVRLTPRGITLTGNTASRDQTLRLIQSIDSHSRLSDNGSNYETRNRRDHFTMNILPVQAGRSR